MKISVIHPTARVKPSAAFANGWITAMTQWGATCVNRMDVEYIVVVHESRHQEFWSFFIQVCLAPHWGAFKVVVNHQRDNLIDQANEGQKAATGEIIIWSGDGMRAPQGWDAALLKACPDTSLPIALHCRRGSPRDNELFIPSCMTRVLADLIGPADPAYEHVFADDEATWKQKHLGRVVETGLVFEQLHPALGTAETDEVFQSHENAETYQRDRAVFERRRAQGFPRVGLPGFDNHTPDFNRVVNSLMGCDAPLLAICTPGDSFPGEWQDAYFNLGLKLGQEGYAVKRYRAFYANVYNTRVQIATRVIQEAKESGQVPKYVLWIDHDNILLPDQLSGLLQFLDHYPDVDGIAGWCWIRKESGWTTSAGNFWPEDGVHLMAMNMDALFAGETTKERFAPKRVEHTGFPAFLMRYSALEKLGPGAFRPIVKADLPAYFGENRPPQEPTDDWFSGEDTSWCLFAKKAGLTLVVDPGCKVGHVKRQLQEPDVVKINNETPKELVEWREKVNGKALTAPMEYQAM